MRGQPVEGGEGGLAGGEAPAHEGLLLGVGPAGFSQSHICQGGCREC